MEPANRDYRAFVQRQFDAAQFIQELGVRLVDFGPGWCETALRLDTRHRQQDGFGHAGVIATLADHTSGMAAGTLCPADKKVLTAEYKINLMRPAVGEALTCRADVIKPGRSLSVVQARVSARLDGDSKDVAVFLATMALAD